ncbi:hypothetical protein FA15DRAFT_667378 [Coprinopsis marcescibilis]|uniref:IPT/TIG domain-containing protein n=1 Tax=Coprinopsis marcescibilis TaxID=230819 RepID=A0A5C3L0L6_COPMA|nr:hypothetical protein FA15DRAFT_667378 [Coprinopsis marcescibilis]
MPSSSPSSVASPLSSSPRTPEAQEYSDPIIHTDVGLSSSWYMSMAAKAAQQSWGSDNSYHHPVYKIEEHQMLQLDELLEQDAYEDSPSPPSHSSSSTHPSPLLQYSENPTHHQTSSQQPDVRPNAMLVSSHSGPISVTKPIPPPAPLPRRYDSSANQRVVYPPKESCHNFPIIFPSIPEAGTKSRVETQIRVTVDLVDPSSSTDPYKYDKIGSWKWLRLPPGTATKKRTRKQGKIDPDAEDVLQLAVSVTCASPPHNRVLSCSSCQVREAKRVAKKLAARVRPAKSESESDGEGGKTGRRYHEDTTNIIQFNCAEIIDFETGSTVLPLRITCYCRHHREKVGFNVHFTMMDHTGRLVGSGMSKPIMITDDHKTTGANSGRTTELVAGFSGLPSPDWTREGLRAQMPAIDTKAPSKRKRDSISSTNGKGRPKPYDSANKTKKFSREGSVSSLPSPTTTYSCLPSAIPTRSPTPSMLHNLATAEAPSAYSQPPVLQSSAMSSETSSPDTLATPLDHNSDVYMPEVHHPSPSPRQLLQAMTSHVQHQSQVQSSLAMPMNIPSMMIPPQAHSMPFLLFDTNQSSQSLQLQVPTIHRLIPNIGPTHGGIEVTVLGANFHPSIQLNCVFGDTAASSTQRWSENTLVCVLPPRAIPGVVVVWFEGFPKMEEHSSSPPSLFTYSDESDRALMELALQVVGLKMTGKIEDAKNVAMRIVGTAGSEKAGHHVDHSGTMQMQQGLMTTSNLRSMLLQPTEPSEIEKKVLDFLSILDTPLDDDVQSRITTPQALSFPSPSGQTLLHLAAFLRFPTLVKSLVDHGIDIDARDRNGYTALHFAALAESSECAKVLIDAGADQEIVNSLGKIPQEIAPKHFFDDIIPTYVSEPESPQSEDEEAEWGDGEDDAREALRSITLRRRASQRALRRSAQTSSRNTPHTSGNVSRTMSPLPIQLVSPPEEPSKADLVQADEKVRLDEKQTASFMEKMIQRTLAQLPAQGFIPQLPMPHLPDLPNVPWGALPHIPIVFPVYVPMMGGWPSFLGGEAPSGESDKLDGQVQDRKIGAAPMRAAQELWEKWVALAVATTARQQQQGSGVEEVPPPVYTAEPSAGETTQKSTVARPSVEQPVVLQQPVTPEGSQVAVEDDNSLTSGQESDPVTYQPIVKHKPKSHKQNDRMLLFFWLPILLLSLFWAVHTGVGFVSPSTKHIASKNVL